MPLPTIQIPQSGVPPSSDEIYAGRGTVQRDDANNPDVTITGGHAERPIPYAATDGGYVGMDERVLDIVPGMMPTYEFNNPDPGNPGSVDRINAQDIGGVPGTDALNYKRGPVTGFAMDAESSFEHQVLVSTPPGSYGPVVGGEDYSTLVSNATFQQAFSQYSTAPSDQTITAAI